MKNWHALYVCAYFKSVLSRWNKTNTRLHSFGPTIECIHVYMCWLDNIEHRLHEKIWSRDLNCRLLFKLTTFVRLISRGISLHYQLTRIIFISHSTVWKYVNSIYWSVVFFYSELLHIFQIKVLITTPKKYLNQSKTKSPNKTQASPGLNFSTFLID